MLMLQIKIDRRERKNKLFIDSIKLAVSSHLEHIHNKRFKTLPNKSNLLLAISKKSRKKVNNQEMLDLQKSGSLMNVLERNQRCLESQFLDSHIDFQQYSSNYKGEISKSHSPKSPNISLKDISLKPILPSRIVVKDVTFENQAKEQEIKKLNSRRRNSSQNSFEKPSFDKIEVQELKKKEGPSRLFPTLPQIPRLKNFSISYKEILFGKSLELNKKSSKDLLKDIHSSCSGLQGSLKRKPSFRFPHLQLSRSLDHSLRFSQEGELALKKEQSIPVQLKRRTKKVERYHNQNISFSPWSTKKSNFK